MSEFCRQCHNELFLVLDDESMYDFFGLSNKADDLDWLYPVVLCEGCGVIQVDSNGYCISVDCIRAHGENN